MKRFGKRILALLLVLVMAVPLCGLQVFAASTGTVKSKRTFDNYLVIGDSILAGYGLKGMVEDFPYTIDNYFGLTGPEVVEDSAPQLIADAIGAKHTYKMAREFWTAANILRLIDDEYNAELAQPKNYYARFLSEVTYFIGSWMYPGDLEDLRNEAVTEIKNADVITLDLGSNDTFSLALCDPWFRTMYYMYGMEVQPALTYLKNQFSTPTSLQDMIDMVGGYDELVNNLNKNIAIYVKNYDRLIKDIRELNPDCEIYVAGIYNLFGQATPKGSMLQSALETLNLQLIDELKVYYTETSEYRDEITYVDVIDTEVWDSFPMYTPFYYTSFLVQIHPDRVGHQYLANRYIKAMNKNAPKTGEKSK